MTARPGEAAPHEAVIESPVGQLRLVSSDNALTRIDFLGGAGKNITRTGKLPALLALAVRQLDDYFRGRSRRFDVPLAPEGTQFQRDVWNALLLIPFGSTTTYGELARRIGRPAAVRAVGAANGANPIPIIIPCHRVIGSDGSLIGYGGGIATKRYLLKVEGVHVPEEPDFRQKKLFER